MGQFSYSISDEAGAAFLADVNSALQANATMNSGTAAPGTTYGNLLWVDTTNNLVKKRNNANAAWQTFAGKDFDVWLLGDGAVGAPAYSFSADPDTGLYRIGANNVGVAANGAKVLDIGTTGLGITGVVQATGRISANAPSILASGNELLTIDVSGASAIAATIRNDAGAAAPALVLWNQKTTTDNLFQQFITEASFTIRGGVNFNRAGVAVQYLTTSDGRLKIDHGPAKYDEAWISAVAETVRDVEWKETGYRMVATIAQLLHKVEPDAVRKGDDDPELKFNEQGRMTSDIWGVDPSKLVFKLIQETAHLRQRLDAMGH